MEQPTRTQLEPGTKRFVIAAALALGSIALLALVTGLNFDFRYDERHHVHFTKYIAAHPTLNTVITYEGAGYDEAKAPLHFIIGAVYGSVVGFDLLRMRVLAIAFGIGTIGAQLWLARRFRAERAPYWAAIVLLPYFLILTVTYMTDVPTLCFLLIAACGYFSAMQQPTWSRLFVAVTGMTCAAYIRIDSCYLLGAIGLASLWHRQLNWRMIAALAAPVLLRLPLIIAWGGLAAPPAQARGLAVETGFHPAHLSFVLSVLGLYFWPFAAENILRNRGRLLIAGAITLAGAFFLPKFDPEQVDYYGGLLRSIFITSRAPVWLVNVGLISSMFVGALVFLRIVLDGDRRDPLVLALRLTCIIGIIVQSVRGEVIYERYLLQVSPFILGLLITSARSKYTIWIWMALAAAMLIPHLIQQKFFV